jgi:ribulose 1,5-bisphosphate synthetase/thiazole synthase
MALGTSGAGAAWKLLGATIATGLLIGDNSMRLTRAGVNGDVVVRVWAEATEVDPAAVEAPVNVDADSVLVLRATGAESAITSLTVKMATVA